MSSKKIIVALDGNNLNKILRLTKKLKNEALLLKSVMSFFNFGISGYNKIYSVSPKIFLDLKLHDIPNTVKNGHIAINKLKPIFSTIHITGGDEMMKSVNISKAFTKVLGVSILTSLDVEQTKKYYNKKNISLLVKKFANYAKKMG